jgi:hypothetical protein
MRGRVLHGLSGCAKFRLLSARFKESFPRDEPYVLELSAPHFLPAAAAFSGLEGSDPRQFPLESEGLDRTLQKEHEMTGKEIDGSHEMPHCSPAAGTCPRVDEYEALLATARQHFDQHPSVAALFRDRLEPDTLEAFLIYFSALGVGMTEPVDGWIRRAGRRCGELGLSKLGNALEAHAHQEAGHHLLMQADANRLVDRWNASRQPSLSATALFALAPTKGVTAYRSLHEDVIAGPAPYGQLAIEYEIEMLSVAYGPRLIERCTRLLGPGILEALSFLSDHVALDVGHTHFNRLQLSSLLDENPSYLSNLVSAGSAALEAYAMFFDDCLGLGRQTLLP